jgi:hypothetical protein
MDANEKSWRGFYPDYSVERAKTEHNRRKVNKVFIPPDIKPEVRPFCMVCVCYMVYIKDKGYECPRCFTEFEDTTKDVDVIKSKYTSRPIIASKKSTNREKRPADFPHGAQITSEVETLPDGSSREIEYGF